MGRSAGEPDVRGEQCVGGMDRGKKTTYEQSKGTSTVGKHVTGDVTVRLFKGTATSVSATSPHSLFSEDLATFGDSATFDQADSRGFVKLYGLPGSVAAKVQGTDSGANR